MNLHLVPTDFVANRLGSTVHKENFFDKNKELKSFFIFIKDYIFF